MAAVSHKVVRDVGAEALAGPPGSLLIIDPPLRSSEWSIPISLRPPFSSNDVAQRAFIVSMRPLHCCRDEWFQDTRRTLRTWLDEHSEAPVLVLHWDPLTGELTRTMERDDPGLRQLVTDLMAQDSARSLDIAIFKLVTRQARL